MSSAPLPAFELTVDTARAIAAAVAAVPGVHSLYGGVHGEVAALYPNARVLGIKRLDLRDDRKIAVYVVADVSARPVLRELGPEIQAAARAVCPELVTVDVVIADAAKGEDADAN